MVPHAAVITFTLPLISGKHKMVILYCLMEFETVRFNELKWLALAVGVPADNAKAEVKKPLFHQYCRMGAEPSSSLFSTERISTSYEQ